MCGFSLDELAQAVTREWDEHDFDVEPVLAPEPSTRLPPYIAVLNSPLLFRRAFAEYEVGFTIYRRIRNYLLFYDSVSPVAEYRIDVELWRTQPDSTRKTSAG